MYKTILAFLLIALTTGCSTYSGTQSTAEMEFCWERGMNFQWIEEFDAGCVDPTAQSPAMRISKIKWLDTRTEYSSRGLSCSADQVPSI